MLKKIIDTFFYGNFFAGICAVMLCIETNMQHGFSLNGIHFYSLIFLGTSYYYTFTYLKNLPNDLLDDRAIWYKTNAVHIKQFQRVILIFLLADIGFFIYKYHLSFSKMASIQYGQIMLFPVVALTYTFNLLPFPDIKKLRRIGWLKPFIIGFVWSGFVSVYPIIFYQIQTNAENTIFAMPSGLLWLKNFLFISTLCVMFDLKDFEIDKKEGLKTFAVQFGVKNTIRYIIIPLVIICIAAFAYYIDRNNFPYPRIIMNLIPYLFLIIISYALLKKKRKIIYYLFVIDGLMILKAVCGIMGMLLIN
jgi:4-hydroxybenzoate polyprenyltransferase